VFCGNLYSHLFIIRNKEKHLFLYRIFTGFLKHLIMEKIIFKLVFNRKNEVRQGGKALVQLYVSVPEYIFCQDNGKVNVPILLETLSIEQSAQNPFDNKGLPE
jgi:hypothetical protein